ncbi:MAG TPA: GntR family transcriptional regulator [Bosea sp. (in: a-proteobacteria)]|jgi:DNA-binding GntR family transcriptional regulator|uniref:GntR family transcriptional regulator n=1 Tax=Bosea sp. (in: a-proteobacteria) TaxID=1871050 RepID=UPI002E0EDD30|nr:GntR family transcriptional regulator [Bosea sp. (in: a-proteobacteria)]
MAKASEKTTLSTTVYQKLRNAIIQGEFRPGAKMRIESLADSYGVGSNAVREALSRLSAERLVERYEHRGFAVPAIALEDWRILVRTRCWLETKALEEAMAHRTESWEEAIVLALHRLSRFRSDKEDERAGWEDAHRNFHRALLANCGSPWLLEFCDVLADHATRYVFVSHAYGNKKRQGFSEHEALMKAVLHGTSSHACDLLQSHYMKTFESVESLFKGGILEELSDVSN